MIKVVLDVTHHCIELLFDNAVFPPGSLDTEEIVFRSMLQIHGIDPRIDLSDFEEPHQPAIQLNDSEISMHRLLETLKERAKSDLNRQEELFQQSRRLYRSMQHMHLKKLESGYDNIIMLMMSTDTLAIIHRETIQKANNGLLTDVRFNRHSLVFDAKSTNGVVDDTQLGHLSIEYLIDPLVLDGLVDDTKIISFIDRIMPERFAASHQYANHPLVKELEGVIASLKNGQTDKSVSGVSRFQSYQIPTRRGLVDVVQLVRKSNRSLSASLGAFFSQLASGNYYLLAIALAIIIGYILLFLKKSSIDSW
jgi:hypothetical protein